MINYKQFKELLKDYTHSKTGDLNAKLAQLDAIVIAEYSSFQNAVALCDFSLDVYSDEVLDEQWPIIFAICRSSDEFELAMKAQALQVCI